MGKQRLRKEPTDSPYKQTSNDQTTVLQRAQQTLQDLRAVIREGHALLKDLGEEQKKARQLLPMLIQKRIAAAVSAEMDQLKHDIDEATKKKAALIGEQLDGIIALLTERKGNEMTVQELAETLGPLIPVIHAIMTHKIKPHDVFATRHSADITELPLNLKDVVRFRRTEPGLTKLEPKDLGFT